MRAIFSRFWSTFIGLDTRLKNSAVATIFLSIVTGAIIGLPGYFKADAQTLPDANISPALYRTKLVEEACYFDKFIALEKQTLMATLPMTQAPTPENFVLALQSYVDLARSARPVVGDMQRTMNGVVPPREFAEDHQKFLDSVEVMQKIVDDLDRSLPTGLNRTPQQLFADPAVIERILNATRVITGSAQSLGSVTYSEGFIKLMDCPNLEAAAPVR